MTKNKIKVFVDGPEILEINEFLNLDGFTFNPSLFKKLGATSINILQVASFLL